MTIFGGIPSVALLENSMSDEEFERYMKNLFREIAPGDRFILGVSDTTPPECEIRKAPPDHGDGERMGRVAHEGVNTAVSPSLEGRTTT